MLAGDLYTSAEDTVTLDAAHASLDRIDIIVVDTSSNVVAVTGTPAAAPVKPQPLPESQVELTSIYVAALATVPDVTDEQIYDENIEWTGTETGGATVDFADTSNPKLNSTNIEVTTISDEDALLFTTTDITITDFETLSLYIDLKAVMTKQHSLNASFLNSGVQVSTEIKLPIDISITGAYQLITVNIADMNLTDDADQLKLRWNKAGAATSHSGFYMDDIKLEAGIVQPPIGVYQNLWETIAADTGSTTADNIADVLTVAGVDGIVTSIVDDTLTVASTEKVKVSATDPTGDYLMNQLGEGNEISFTQEGIGVDESVAIHCDITLPGSSVDNTLPRFDLTAGKTLQTTGIVVDDSDNMSGVANLSAEDVTLSDPPRCRAYLSGNQLNFTDNTYEIVELDATTYDSGGIFDTGANRCTPDKEGYYLVIAELQWTAVATDGQYFFLGIHKNGSLAAQDISIIGADNKGSSVRVSDIIYCNGSTDYIELFAKQWSGFSTQDVRGGTEYTYMCVHKLS